MSGTQAGGSGTEGQDEYMGAFAVPSSSRPKRQSETTDAEMFFLVLSLVPYICRTLQVKNVSVPSLHHITAERRASYSVRVFTALRFSPS